MCKVDLEPADCWYFSFERFVDELRFDEYFSTLSREGQQSFFKEYCRQLVDDYDNLITILQDNFISRKNVPELVRRKARELMLKLETARHSPSFLDPFYFEFMVMSLLNDLGNDDLITLPYLFTLFEHEQMKEYVFAPSVSHAQRTNQGSMYGRYDIYEHPLFKELRHNLCVTLFGRTYDETRSDGVRLSVTNAGSSTFLNFIEAVQVLRRSLISNEAVDRPITIARLNTAKTYFETSKVMANAGNAFGGMQLPYTGDFLLPHTYKNQGIGIVTINDWELKSSVLRMTDQSGVCIFYLENIANNERMDVPDLEQLFLSLSLRKALQPGVSSVFIYIDATVLGGSFDPFDLARRCGLDDGVNIVVGQSLTKFLAFGVNKSNAGLLYGRGKDVDMLFDQINQSRTTEGLPLLSSLCLLPMTSKNVVEKRKNRFGKNALFLATELQNRFPDDITIVYPGLKQHKGHVRASELYDDYFGPFFFIAFNNDAKDSMERYSKFMSYIQTSTHVDVGTSFGLNKTRLELREHNIRIDGSQPVPYAIRVAVGQENIKQRLSVLDDITKAIQFAAE